MKIEWYEEYDFDENPLEPNPLDAEYDVINMETETKELLYRIAAGSMVLVVGKDGTGKSALLNQAIKRFKGKGRVIYVDGSRLSKRLNIEKLLINRSGLVKGRLLKKKPRGMILLLDNVQNISMNNNRLIKYYFDQDYLKSVVFATSDIKLLNLDNSILSRIGSRIIMLRPLSEAGAIKLIKSRIGDDLLDTDTIKNIYSVSNKSANELLVNTSLVLDSEKKSPSKEEITKIISKKEIEEVEKDRCGECGEELEKINEEWRCPVCDVYCKDCGSLADEEEENCPRCAKPLEVEK